MYISLKNPTRAKEQLNRLEETAKAAQNDSLSNDFLYTQASYYYTFGMNSQGDTAFKKLIEQYKQQKNYSKADECYQNLINIASGKRYRINGAYLRQIHYLDRFC